MSKIIKEKYNDITGQVFHGCKAIQYMYSDEKRRNFWEWQCPRCGNLFIAREDRVKSGNTRSCGCLQTETRKMLGKAVGLSNKKQNLVIHKKEYAIVFYNNYDGFFVVDEKDFPVVQEHTWYAHKGAKGRIDPVTYIDGTTVRLVRFLLAKELEEAPDGMEVDHINLNTNDCRRCNLRICTHEENMRNRPNNKQGRIIEKNSKFRIVDFAKVDTSHLVFDTYMEAEIALFNLQNKHLGEFGRRFSQEIAREIEIHLNHKIVCCNGVFEEIQSLPERNIFKIWLNSIFTDYRTGRLPEIYLGRALDNLKKAYHEERPVS